MLLQHLPLIIFIIFSIFNSVESQSTILNCSSVRPLNLEIRAQTAYLLSKEIRMHWNSQNTFLNNSAASWWTSTFESLKSIQSDRFAASNFQQIDCAAARFLYNRERDLLLQEVSLLSAGLQQAIQEFQLFASNFDATLSTAWNNFISIVNKSQISTSSIQFPKIALVNVSSNGCASLNFTDISNFNFVFSSDFSTWSLGLLQSLDMSSIALKRISAFDFESASACSFNNSVVSLTSNLRNWLSQFISRQKMISALVSVVQSNSNIIKFQDFGNMVQLLSQISFQEIYFASNVMIFSDQLLMFWSQSSLKHSQLNALISNCSTCYTSILQSNWQIWSSSHSSVRSMILNSLSNALWRISLSAALNSMKSTLGSLTLSQSQIDVPPKLVPIENLASCLQSRFQTFHATTSSSIGQGWMLNSTQTNVARQWTDACFNWAQIQQSKIFSLDFASSASIQFIAPLSSNILIPMNILTDGSGVLTIVIGPAAKFVSATPDVGGAKFSFDNQAVEFSSPLNSGTSINQLFQHNSFLMSEKPVKLLASTSGAVASGCLVPGNYSADCVSCPVGSWCPGDGLQYLCSNAPASPSTQYTTSSWTNLSCPYICLIPGMIASDAGCSYVPAGFFVNSITYSPSPCVFPVGSFAYASAFSSPGLSGTFSCNSTLAWSAFQPTWPIDVGSVSAFVGSSLSTGTEPINSGKTQKVFNMFQLPFSTLQFWFQFNVISAMTDLNSTGTVQNAVGMTLVSQTNAWTLYLLLEPSSSNGTISNAQIVLETVVHRTDRNSQPGPRSSLFSLGTVAASGLTQWFHIAVQVSIPTQSIQFFLNGVSIGTDWIGSRFCNISFAVETYWTLGGRRMVYIPSYIAPALFIPLVGSIDEFQLHQSLIPSEYLGFQMTSNRVNQQSCNFATSSGCTSAPSMVCSPGTAPTRTVGQCSCPSNSVFDSNLMKCVAPLTTNFVSSMSSSCIDGTVSYWPFAQYITLFFYSAVAVLPSVTSTVLTKLRLRMSNGELIVPKTCWIFSAVSSDVVPCSAIFVSSLLNNQTLSDFQLPDNLTRISFDIGSDVPSINGFIPIDSLDLLVLPEIGKSLAAGTRILLPMKSIRILTSANLPIDMAFGSSPPEFANVPGPTIWGSQIAIFGSETFFHEGPVQSLPGVELTSASNFLASNETRMGAKVSFQDRSLSIASTDPTLPKLCILCGSDMHSQFPRSKTSDCMCEVANSNTSVCFRAVLTSDQLTSSVYVASVSCQISPCNTSKINLFPAAANTTSNATANVTANATAIQIPASNVTDIPHAGHQPVPEVPLPTTPVVTATTAAPMPQPSSYCSSLGLHGALDSTSTCIFATSIVSVVLICLMAGAAILFVKYKKSVQYANFTDEVTSSGNKPSAPSNATPLDTNHLPAVIHSNHVLLDESDLMVTSLELTVIPHEH